ncbi:hypothetical protein BC833DRAFT_227323 [Globomyces pollinis-pini]|nr:hypothetical protein BC833DRAFT_227323 [Globomyces pollinis-pini]
MFPYLYWLSNSFQLLIYLKRDTTLLVNTFEFQCKLTDFMDDLYQLFHNYLHHLTKLLIHSCIIQYQNEDYLKNIKYDSEFFGFNRRKTELKSIDDFESKLLKHQEFEMQHLNQTIFNNETDITIKQHIIKMKIILNQYYQNNDPSHISRLDKLNQIPIDEFNPQFIIIITQLILLFSQTCLLDESMMTQILKRYTENFIHQMFLSIIKDRYLMSRMKSKQIHHHIIYIKTTIQHTLKGNQCSPLTNNRL